MRNTNIIASLLATAALAAATTTLRADIVVPGSDTGSDGALAYTTNTVIDLSMATTGVWDATSPSPTHGIYDPAKWAIIFKYSTVNIPAGVTVTFKNHPSRAPVIWLVSGTVTIAGSVNLDGEPSTLFGRPTEPGPGGGYGGISYLSDSAPQGPGFGYGGGQSAQSGGAGSFASQGSTRTWGNGSLYTVGASGTPYGNAQVIPLLGGSGGAGSLDRSGGAGGGAILIASRKVITISGAITANGTTASGTQPTEVRISGVGSGGAIRLVADTIKGGGSLAAYGQQALSSDLHGPTGGYWSYLASVGGRGRIRLESRVNTAGSIQTIPGASVVDPGPTAQIWPPTNAPTLRIKSIAGTDSPGAPLGNINSGFTDIQVNSGTTNAQIILESQNLSVDPPATIQVRVVPKFGSSYSVTAAFQSGTYDLATWVATTQLPAELSVLQARALSPQ